MFSESRNDTAAQQFVSKRGFSVRPHEKRALMQTGLVRLQLQNREATVKEISDDVLIEEIKKRFLENKNALHDLRVVMKKLESVNEKLRQSESLKSNFLSNIRNEINNPLTAILGMSKLLAAGATDPQEAVAMADTIYQEAFALDFQLRNIFTAAEIEAGETALHVYRTDVARLVHSLIDSFQHKADEKQLSVAFEREQTAPKEDLYIKTDPEKFSCMLSNLLANAIEYAGDGKKVRITARKDGTQLIVAVADEGVGIAEKDREKIFDRFSQLDMGAKKRHKGHGLGLSITKALAEMLNGTITFSCPSGKGCVFTLTLHDIDGSDTLNDLSGDSNEYFFDGATTF